MTMLIVLIVAVVVAGLLVGMPMLSSNTSEPLDTERLERWFVRHAPRRVTPLLRRADRHVIGGALTAVAFVAVLGAALAVGWIFDTIDERRGIARWDEAAAEWGAANATPTSTRVLEAITHLGGTEYLLIAMGAVGLTVFVRTRRFGPLAYLAIVGLGVTLINNALKWAVDRERPDIAQLTGHGGSSFPSGHSAAAAACWAAIALVVARRQSRPIRIAAAVTAVAIAIAVAASRVLLGVHWVSDVVAGLIVGWTWFFLVTVIFGGRLLRFGEPVERVGDNTIAHDVDRELAAESDQIDRRRDVDQRK